MTPILNKLKKSVLFQRVLKLGIAYVAVELLIAIGVIFFVTQKAIA